MPDAMSHTFSANLSRGGTMLDGADERLDTKQMERGMVRRPGREQGMALEALGHAVDYLVDSRMFLDMPYTRAEEEAVQILMSLSRQVFESCPQVLPLRTRVADGLLRLVLGPGA